MMGSPTTPNNNHRRRSAPIVIVPEATQLEKNEGSKMKVTPDYMLTPRRGASRTTSNRKATRSPRRHSAPEDSVVTTAKQQQPQKESDTSSESTAASKEVPEMKERDILWTPQSSDDRSVEVIVPDPRGRATPPPGEIVPLNVVVRNNRETKIIPLKKVDGSSDSHRYRQPSRSNSSSSHSSRKSAYSRDSGEIQRRHSNDDTAHGSHHFDVDVVDVQPRRNSHDGVGGNDSFRSHSESHRDRRSAFLPAASSNHEFRTNSESSRSRNAKPPVYVDSSQIEWNSHFPTTAAAASDLKSAMKQPSSSMRNHKPSQPSGSSSGLVRKSSLKRHSSMRRHSNESAVSNSSSHHEMDPPLRRRSNEADSVMMQRSSMKQAATSNVLDAVPDMPDPPRRSASGDTYRTSGNKKHGDELDFSSGHGSTRNLNKVRPSFQSPNRDQKLGDYISRQRSKRSQMPFGDDDDSTFVPSSDAGSLLGDISVRQKSVRHLHESVDDDGFGSIAGSRKGTYEGFR